MIKRFLSKSTILASAILSIVLLAFPLVTSAQYNPNDLIDTGQFDNYNAMSASQIDSFLNNNFGSASCISTSAGFTAPDVTGYSSTTNQFSYGPPVSAGTVIYHAAQIYGINPQVLLATMQKEESLLNGAATSWGPGCSAPNFASAMGYGCFDSNTTVFSYSYPGQLLTPLYYINGNPVDSVSQTCVSSAQDVGFSEQLITAAWLLRFSEQRAVGNTSWNVQLTNYPYPGDTWDNSNDPTTSYSGFMTQGIWARVSGGATAYYDGYATIDNTSVYMSNGPTAALYTYTPHLAGNSDFDNIFELYFGLSIGEGYTLATSYDDNGDARQWVVYQGMRHLVPDTQTLTAWGLNKVTLVQWSGTYLGSFPDGPPLTRLFRPDGTLDVYFVDGGNAYKIGSPAMLAAWNFNPASIVDVTTFLGQVPTNQGYLSYSVRVAGDTTGTTYLVDGGILRPYANQILFNAWEGDGAGYTTISADYFTAMGGSDPNGATPISSDQIVNGTQDYEVVAGNKLPETTAVSTLYPGSPQTVSLATINRLNTLQNASQFITVTGSNTIYMVDNSVAYPIPTPLILIAWGGATPNVNTVGQSNFDLLTTGATLNTYEADVSGQLYLLSNGQSITVPANLDSNYRTSSNVHETSQTLISLIPSAGTASSFIKTNSSPAVYLMDQAVAKLIPSPADLTHWTNGGSITTVTSDVMSQFTVIGMVGSFVTDGTNNYVIDGASKHLVSPQVQSAWSLSQPALVSASTLANFPNGVALSNQFQSNSEYFYATQGTGYLTVDPNIAGVWGIGSNAPSFSLSLASEYLNINMMTRFAMSNIPGDTRLFVVDNGVLYYLSPYQAANLGLVAGTPLEAVNPGLITPNISSWTATLVQDDSGKPYVIDGGGKRYFPNPQVLASWTNNGTITATTVTNGFLNLLPTIGYIARGVQDNNPPVYDVIGATKDWIQSPSEASLYGPIQTVSGSLINSLPSGPNM